MSILRIIVGFLLLISVKICSAQSVGGEIRRVQHTDNTTHKEKRTNKQKQQSSLHKSPQNIKSRRQNVDKTLPDYTKEDYMIVADSAYASQAYAEALKWYQKAAELKVKEAYAAIGYMYHKGSGVQNDDTEAIKWYRKGVEQGEAKAQRLLGFMYQNGLGVLQDYKEAVRLYHLSAEQSDAPAQNNLGWMFANGLGVAKDEAAAVNWYRKAAEQGHAQAQNNLGRMFANGLGVAKDEVAAVNWYRKAAEQGHADAQTNLGFMFEKGLGVAKDEVAAVSWYRKAAEQGEARAQNNLGWMFANGLGVAKDELAAVNWYRKAAEQGHAQAQNNLGGMFANGFGVPADLKKALYWFTKSATLGDPAGQYNLARAYYTGAGTKQDFTEALKWYKVINDANPQIYSLAKKMIGEIEERLNANQSSVQNSTPVMYTRYTSHSNIEHYLCPEGSFLWGLEKSSTKKTEEIVSYAVKIRLGLQYVIAWGDQYDKGLALSLYGVGSSSGDHYKKTNTDSRGYNKLGFGATLSYSWGDFDERDINQIGVGVERINVTTDATVSPVIRKDIWVPYIKGRFGIDHVFLEINFGIGGAKTRMLNFGVGYTF